MNFWIQKTYSKKGISVNLRKKSPNFPDWSFMNVKNLSVQGALSPSVATAAAATL
jgi:hypothetical protein